MIEKRFYVTNLEQRAEDGQTYLEGHAAIFNTWSKPFGNWFREKIDPGAFARALSEKQDTVCNFMHRDSELLGRTTSGTLELSTDEKGLHFRVKLPNTSTANDLKELISRGDVKDCSFAFTVQAEKWEKSSEPSLEEDRTILEVDRLIDVSIVVFPAYEGTDLDLMERGYRETIKQQEPTPPEEIQLNDIEIYEYQAKLELTK